MVASAPIEVDSAGLVMLPVAVRNGTNESITSVEVSGAPKDETGKILASGRSQGFSPAVVPAGGISLGYVFFSAKLPTTAKLEFTVASKPLQGIPTFRT